MYIFYNDNFQINDTEYEIDFNKINELKKNFVHDKEYDLKYNHKFKEFIFKKLKKQSNKIQEKKWFVKNYDVIYDHDIAKKYF